MSGSIHRPDAPVEIGVIDLTVKNDVQGELKLGDKEMQMLEFVADRGGEVPWSWEPSPGSKATPEQLKAVHDRVCDLICGGYLTEREYMQGLSIAKLTLRLTDTGRNVVAIHRKRKIVASEVKQLG